MFRTETTEYQNHPVFEKILETAPQGGVLARDSVVTGAYKPGCFVGQKADGLWYKVADATVLTDYEQLGLTVNVVDLTLPNNTISVVVRGTAKADLCDYVIDDNVKAALPLIRFV